MAFRFDADGRSYTKFLLQQLGALPENVRIDSNETAFFLRQLEHIFAETYDTLYTESKARELIPVDFSVHSGATSHTFRQFTEYAEAAIIDDYGDDVPNAEVDGKEFTSKIRGLASGYEYSVQEIRASMMAGGTPLDVRKGEAAKNAILRKMDALACTGDSTYAIQGFADTGNGMTSVSITSKTTANDWPSANGGAGATAADVQADINALQNQVYTGSKGIFSPDTLSVDTTSFAYMATKPQSPTFTEKSILQFILASSPWLNAIIPWARLNTASAATKARFVMYKRDKMCLRQIISQDFEQFAPQAKGLVLRVPCHARFGGVSVRYPLSMAYMDGVQGT